MRKRIKKKACERTSQSSVDKFEQALIEAAQSNEELEE